MADVEQDNSGGFDNEQVVSSSNVELPTDGVQETDGVLDSHHKLSRKLVSARY
ncbi:MAG: hypothetical protein VKK42_30415 [Lyngbya sp.]|nr:hypothetical protein [Lyngbya sp.]